MKDRNNGKKVIIAEIIIIVVAVAALLLPQLIGEVETGTKAESYTSADRLNGKKLGVITGDVTEYYTNKLFPDSTIVQFNGEAEMLLSLSQGKLDGILYYTDPSTYIKIDEYPTIKKLPEVVTMTACSFATAKDERGRALADEYNAFTEKIKANGRYDAITEKWLSDGFEEQRIEDYSYTGEKGVLHAATMSELMPYTYINDDGWQGLYNDLFCAFCAESGYIPEIVDAPFNSLMAGLVSGKYDFLTYGVSYTEERAEQINFTDTISSFPLSMMVYGGESTGYTEFSDLDGVKMAVTSGGVAEDTVEKYLPNSKKEYYQSQNDEILAVIEGKAEGLIIYESSAESVIKEHPELAFLVSDEAKVESAFAAPKTDKGAALAAEYAEFWKEYTESGEFDKMMSKWTDEASEKKPYEYSFSGEKGSLHIAISPYLAPKCYYDNGELIGYTPELCCAFCEYAGYTPDFEDVSYEAALAGIAVGKYDFFAAETAVTKERKERLTFFEPIKNEKLGALVKSDGAVSSGGSKAEAFFSGIASSFEKNFIRENRWQMMAQGLLVTVLLAVFAAIIGTLLGALICLMRRSENAFLTGFARLYIKLFQGMPIVVLLLVLYYVVFGSTDISAFIVCVVGFSLDFAAYVSEIIRSGIDAVPSGQLRAAYALGYGRLRAFLEIVLPQAMRHILPVYRGQFVAMVKMTSIAGYISVQDLTKVSDIIRSRTYEAFFPLITTAIIYFALANLLTSVLKLIQLKTDPDNRRRLPKGVE